MVLVLLIICQLHVPVKFIPIVFLSQYILSFVQKEYADECKYKHTRDHNHEQIRYLKPSSEPNFFGTKV